MGVDQIQEALDYLYTREAILGGYEMLYTKFHARGTWDTEEVLVFTATRGSGVYLGPADTKVMAEQIVGTRGLAGPNIDYVTNIADFVRTHIPEDEDDHLFSLDRTIRNIVSGTNPYDRKPSVPEEHIEQFKSILTQTKNSKNFDNVLPTKYYNVQTVKL